MYVLQEYDDALEYILNNGFVTKNRTGVDTITAFGVQTKYRIDEYFPIPTKRKYIYKSIFAELLWMLSGSTNVNDLEKLGSKIWTSWRNNEFEQKNNYSDGDLGPIYGWQMRYFGADYPSKENGFDQISFIVNELKNNKFSRRILMNLWNPKDMVSDRVALPCCHYSFQLLVDNNDNLTGILTQRSADFPVGSPANIFFYSALIYMLAQQTNLKPYQLIYNTGNTHIYSNQIDQVKEYLSRQIIDSPKLILNKAKDIFSYTLDDFCITDYNPLPRIKIPVLV